MPQLKLMPPSSPSIDEHAAIADRLMCGPIVCRGAARNSDRDAGRRYALYRTGELAADRRGRPKSMGKLTDMDLGPEMALHGEISAALDMDVYFCDPHSPWQRGANEDTNGLLRQCFPKGTDLGIFPEEYLDAVAEELNDRPRKTLGWRKPSEVFLELINDSLTA